MIQKNKMNSLVISLIVLLLSLGYTNCSKTSSVSSPPLDQVVLPIVTPLPSNVTTSAARSFHMGFTPFTYDFSVVDPIYTQGVVDFTYSQILQNSDIVAHHFDNGIPWNEALDDPGPYTNESIPPYNQHILNEWQERKSRTPSTHKMFVAVTPLVGGRNGLANYRAQNDDMPRIAPFDTLTDNFDDIRVKTAYLNYCKRVIAYFNPDYLAIGIEVNLLRKLRNQTVWSRYVILNHFVYTELKKIYPNLPIFVSVAGTPLIYGFENPPSPEFDTCVKPGCDSYVSYMNSQLTALNDVLVDSDYYGIAFYPYFSNYFNCYFPCNNGQTTSAALWEELLGHSQKPIAFTETGYLAQTTQIDSNITFVGSPGDQSKFVTELLDLADKRSFKFIIYWEVRDYDQLATQLNLSGINLVWRDIGLIDENGVARPSFDIWKSYNNRIFK